MSLYGGHIKYPVSFAFFVLTFFLSLDRRACGRPSRCLSQKRRRVAESSAAQLRTRLSGRQTMYIFFEVFFWHETFIFCFREKETPCFLFVCLCLSGCLSVYVYISLSLCLCLSVSVCLFNLCLSLLFVLCQTLPFSLRISCTKT